jgi:hypothetical protein
LSIVVFVGACAEREKALPRVEITTPVRDQSGDVIISYVLYDREDRAVDISVYYSTDGGTTFSSVEATQGFGGDGITGLSSSLRGIAHSYVWDSRQDVGATYNNDVRIRITPTAQSDHVTGNRAYTRNFTVKNSTRVDDGPAGSSAETPVICAYQTTIYAAWSDDRDGDYDIFYSLSTDGGNTWSAAVKVNDVSTGTQRSPAMATDSAGKVYLVWEDGRGTDFDIFISVGEDPGTGFAFGTSTRVDDGTTGDATDPAVAVEGTTVYMVWTDSRNGNPDIFCSSSANGGATWSAAVMVNDGAISDSVSPSVAAGAGKVYAAWSDNSDGNYDIYFSSSADGGATWSAAVKLNGGTTGDATSVSVAVDASTVFVVWADARTDSGDIYFRRSTDSGANWSTEKKVNTDAGTALQTAPECAASGTKVYLVWQDSRDGDPNIYFSESADSGANFTANVRIDDDIVTLSAQSAPEISLQVSSALLIYQDARGGDPDIYFTKK